MSAAATGGGGTIFPFDPAELAACQFHVWYPKFRRHTVRSQVLPLAPAVVEWLSSASMTFPDWLQVVQGSSGDRFLAEDEDPEDEAILDELDELRRQYRSIRPDIMGAGAAAAETGDGGDGGGRPQGHGDSGDAAAQTGDDTEDADAEAPMSAETEAALRQLCDRIKQAIVELGGGRVFAKLNWRAPVDASWITVDNTLASTTPAEVLLLLKSSERIAEDLVDPTERFRVLLDAEGTPSLLPAAPHPGPPPPAPFEYHLVLRRWAPPAATLEFRCFVRDGRLVAISQRSSVKCPVMGSNCQAALARQREIRDLITDFWYEVVAADGGDGDGAGNNGGGFPLNNYCFDVYLGRGDVVKLVDFHPYGPGTAAKLFDWNEAPLLLPRTKAVPRAHPDIAQAGEGLEEDGADEDEPEFRVVDSHGPGRDYQPDVGTIIQRLPADGIDVSDQAGIDRFVEMCRRMHELELSQQGADRLQ